MDVLEKLFQKVWIPKSKKDAKKKSAVLLADIKPYVNAVSKFILGSLETQDVSAAKSYIGYVDNQLYLPSSIAWSNTKQDNKNSYLYLTLLSCATKKLEMKSGGGIDSNIYKRIEWINQSTRINVFLDSIFENFSSFQKRHIEKLIEHFGPIKQNHLFLFWRDSYARRDVENKALPNRLLQTFKARDEVPDLLYYSSVLPYVDSQSAGETSLEIMTSDVSRHKKNMTELKKNHTSPVKKINLEEKKKEFNPVTHSFEKLETADEYSGGYRLESGEDQLKDHMEALEELDMSSVTSQGEAAQSMYSAEIQSFFSNNQSEVKTARNQEFLYSEWFSKKQIYKPEHCLLVQNEVPTAENTHIKDKVCRSYSSQIESYRAELDRIVNLPVWNKRQSEGPELDLDECVRYRSDFLNKSIQTVPRLFAIKKKNAKDLSVFILFDQSLSTDSWVDNTRIYDVIKDSLVMMGILFEGILPDVQIAGTWSATRKNCVFNFLKTTEDSWDSFFLKIDNLEPQGYTRLGPAIRHVGSLMGQQVADKKVLILLTDGRPSDLDTYEGMHGIQDIRKACLELETEGVDTIAVLIEKESKGHFQTMFKRNFIANSPRKIPGHIFSILRSIM